MLKGKELGQAIKAAYELKLARGGISSKADIANHFGIKTPSVYDWFKKGSISKDKLPELWRYFSDVAGPEHWGLAEWPNHASHTGDHGEHATHRPPTDGSVARINNGEALSALSLTVSQLAPILREAARSALIKWAQGNISSAEAASTLDALTMASSSLPGERLVAISGKRTGT